MFDLDGTLVDSVPDIAVAVDAVLVELGFKAAEEGRIRAWVGNGAEVLMRRALAFSLQLSESAVEQRRVDEALQGFVRHYRVSNGQHSRLYPGVKEALLLLQGQGVEQVVITNKPSQFVPALLAQLGINDFFGLWLGGDSLPVKKPDPAPLQHVLSHYRIPPARALMVGDSRNDIVAARAAGVASLAVTYGYNHGCPVAEESPDWLTDNLHAFFHQ